jgi:taurine transport system permease protein
MIFLGVYVATFVVAMLLVSWVQRRFRRNDLTSLKTVTFGDESAVRSDRAASIISIIAIFLIWGAFTGSRLVPFHVPGPFLGEAMFQIKIAETSGGTEDAKVLINVHERSSPAVLPASPSGGTGRHILADVASRRSVLIDVSQAVKPPAAGPLKVVAIEGNGVMPGEVVKVNGGTVLLTNKGGLLFEPDGGLQMDPIWLPSPEAVLARFVEIWRNGYQNSSLWQHVGSSVMRVLAGFFLGSIIGIPLGYAMGLSGWFRGWFDPIVEFMRPVPPLALIPLIIIWFGIWEAGKIVLLFLAALWIMVIAARSGAANVRISKIHAAYSLGANKWQLLRHVIIPNSLPDIFTGARVAMGVCWGTVVAAELVAAQRGAGMMILVASKFQLTDIVVMGIILIGIIGYGIDISMRIAERWLVPWVGRA